MSERPQSEVDGTGDAGKEVAADAAGDASETESEHASGPPTRAAEPRPPAGIGGRRPAGMRTRFGGPWRWLLGWLFRHVKVSDDALASVRALTEKGTVVYVSRTAGLLPFLYFNWLFLRAGLPLARYVGGIRPGVARIFGKGAAPPAPLVGDDGRTSRLAGCVAAGRSALVFLWRRGKPLTGRADFFPGEQAAALVRLQREADRPVFLLPCLLLFGRQPGRKGAGPSLLDLVFGPREAPGRLRSALVFLRFRKSAWVKFGEAIDLSKFVAERKRDDDLALGRKVRGALSVYLAREQRVVTGPPLKHPDRLRMEVLRDRRLRETLAAVAAETGRREADVHREAKKVLKEIAARYSPTLIGLLERVFRIIFQRIYDGIEVDRTGLERVANAARRAPLILCPSHRSHIDYLVLSWVFYNEGLMPPHIAAGKNLSFWPAGPILRRGGAFFIRRTFRDDRVYSAVFRAYVRRLIHEGYPQEFFIEGTRSRTGKLLPPRLGMVAYEVEAFLESARDDLVFVPISIGYTRVIEQKSYRDELLGGEKQAEDVAGLLKAGRVLRRRYGRIYIEFDEPIHLSAFMAERGLHREEMDDEDRARLVRSLAWHVTHGIDRSTTVSPAALAAAALLSDRRRGLEIAEIVARARFLFGYVTRDPHPRISGALVDGGRPHLDAAAIEEAVGAFADDGLVKKHRVAGRTVIEILPDGRIDLDYYKNLLMRHVAERSLLAHALLATVGAHGGILAAKWLPQDEVRRRAHALTRLLSREYVFRPGVPPDRVFDETLEEMVQEAFVERRGGKVRIPRTGEGPLSLLRLLTASVVEGYWLTARAAAEVLAEGPVPEKDLVRRILEEGRVLVLTGRLAASEALSKPVVQGALAVLVEWGLLAREGRRGGAITGDPAALAEVLDVLDGFVLVPDVVPQPRLPAAT